MKDPYSVLREKEHDVERVRKEIQALLTVIALNFWHYEAQREADKAPTRTARTV